MANELSADKKVMAVSMLCEGASIRSIERMTGIHRDTIMRLGVRVGEACKRIMDEKMRNIPAKQIEVDEIWASLARSAKTRHALEITATCGRSLHWTRTPN